MAQFGPRISLGQYQRKKKAVNLSLDTVKEVGWLWPWPCVAVSGPGENFIQNRGRWLTNRQTEVTAPKLLTSPVSIVVFVGVKQLSEPKYAQMCHMRSVKQDGKNAGFDRPKSGKLRSVWACGSEGERLTGSQKVVGSSPTRSISLTDPPYSRDRGFDTPLIQIS